MNLKVLTAFSVACRYRCWVRNIAFGRSQMLKTENFAGTVIWTRDIRRESRAAHETRHAGISALFFKISKLLKIPGTSYLTNCTVLA